MLEIRKKGLISLGDQQAYFLQFFNDCIQGPLMRPSTNLESKIPLDTYRRGQLVYMKVQAHSSLEPPLEYNPDQTTVTSQG